MNRRLSKTTVEHEVDRSAETAALNRLSDEQLLLCYRETGSRSHFAQLVKRYERELYNYLRKYLGDSELAEDVFQATFLLIHTKCDQFQEGRRFRPWMYSIATNAAVDAQRRDRRHQAISLDRAWNTPEQGEAARLVDGLEGRELDPAIQAVRSETDQWVREALEELSEPTRVALHLVYYQGLKYREAAEILNVPVGTVKSRIHTAIQRLTEYLRQTRSDSSEP